MSDSPSSPSTPDGPLQKQPVSAGGRSELPVRGVLLGIDYGTKRVGIAVSDRGQRFSSPLYNYQRQGKQDDHFFRKLVREYEVTGLVVGLPLHLSGDESQKSGEARRYAQWLTDLTGLPHDFQDERFTSSYAEQLLLEAELTKKKRKERIDKLAAQLLLQSFLDRRRKSDPGVEALE
ncbi:MAG: Holliday junction resolvase RuvX [Planctomycetaceae bacterium]|nr:Holliday junction resolvase RuvX [Planctomycetaceae bacterium]